MNELVQPKFKLGDTLYATCDNYCRTPIEEFVVCGVKRTEFSFTDDTVTVFYCDKYTARGGNGLGWLHEGEVYFSAKKAALYLLNQEDKNSVSKKDFILDTLKELEK